MEIRIVRSSDDTLQHHGILGQKWGVRRYQNKDGSLTPAGRKRIGLDRYDDEHNSDFVVKKGTKASRVVTTKHYDEWADPNLGGSKKLADKYLKDTLDKDSKLEQKYVSIDNVRNSGRANGKDYYLSWFTEEGLSPTYAQVTMYELQKDAKVASGKKVAEALLEEVGSKTVKEMLKQGKTVHDFAMDYTADKDLFNRVNKKFADKGYDAIEDINDLDTDMPLIMLNSSKSLGKKISTQSGKDAIEETRRKIQNGN